MFKFLAGAGRRALSSAVKPKDPLHLILQPQQVLLDRYKILERLGQGQESTVWLAEELATASKKTVALKVLTDYVTSLQEEHAFELRVMQRISNLPSTNPNLVTRNLLPLFDHFFAPGVRGNHLCLVTEALGPSLLEVLMADQGRMALPPDVVKHLVRQILRALESLHDGCRVVHTDIKPDNILFRRSMVTEDDTFDGSRVFDPENVVLTDYGTAVPLEVETDRLIQPVALRSPEVLLGCRWGVKTDIWNLGCIIFELLTASNLFNPRPIGKYTAEQYHFARIHRTLANDANEERLREFFKTGREYGKFFNEKGDLFLAIGAEYRESLRQILEVYGVYTPELLELLEAMLQVHPEDRLSASQLQALAWLRQ